jgi:hypothetical protein
MEVIRQSAMAGKKLLCGSRRHWTIPMGFGVRSVKHRLMFLCDLAGVSTRSVIDLGLGVVVCGLAALPATRSDELAIPIDPGTPSFAGLAFGAYPDYFGSDDQALGAAPLVRIKLSGERFMRVLGNEVRVNLLEHTGWRLGPSAISVHLGPRWHVGAGALYTRLLGDTADSPIVEERGNADQWIYGAGVLYGW